VVVRNIRVKAHGSTGKDRQENKGNRADLVCGQSIGGKENFKYG